MYDVLIIDITYISTQHQSIQFPKILVEAVESAKANAAACRKAPLESPKNDSAIPNQKGVEGSWVCSKDMFDFFFRNILKMLENLRDRLEVASCKLKSNQSCI